MEIDLHIDILTVKALAVNPKIYKEIDALYDQEKSKYIEYAKKSEWYQSRYFRENRIEVEIYSLKLLGIMSCAMENNETILLDNLNNLLKKTYRKTYNYVQSQEKTVHMSKFIQQRYKDIVNLPTTEVSLNFGAFFWFIQHSGKKLFVDTQKSLDFINLIKAYIESTRDQIIPKLPPEKEIILKKIKVNLRKKYGTVRSLLDYSISEHYKKNTMFEFLESTCTLDMVSFDFLEYITFSENDIDNILKYYLCYFYKDIKSENDVDLEQLQDIYILALTIRSFAREYNFAKNMIIEKTSELSAIEESNKIRAELQAARAENMTLRQEIATKQALLNESQIEIDRLQRKIEKAQEGQLSQTCVADKPLDTNDILTPQDDVPSLDLDHLTDKKVVIVGGHPKLQQRLRSRYNDFTYIDTDNINFDVNTLQSVDTVIFVYNYLSHALYTKIIDYTRRKKIKVAYIRSINDKLSLTDFI